MPSLNKFVKLLFILNGGVLLIPDRFKAIPIALLFIAVLVTCFLNREKTNTPIKPYLVSIAYYLIYIVSFFISEEKQIALSRIETSISLLVIPTLFYLINKEVLHQKALDAFKISFITSAFIFLNVSFVYFFLTEPYYTFKSTLVHYSNLVNIRTTYYKIHPIYLSISIGVSLIFCFDLLKRNANTIKKVFSFILILNFIIFLSILNKKGPILFLGVVSVIYVFKSKLNYKKIITVVSFLILLVSFIIMLPKYKNINIYNELISLVNLKTNDATSTGKRVNIYRCAINSILEAPLIGYGIGDVDSTISKCLKERNVNTEYVLYNTHNQYFSFIMAGGFLCFIAFLYYLWYLLKNSENHDSEILYILTIYFFLNMLTENILEREDGVIMFALIINTYLFKNKNLC